MWIRGVCKTLIHYMWIKRRVFFTPPLVPCDIDAICEIQKCENSDLYAFQKLKEENIFDIISLDAFHSMHLLSHFHSINFTLCISLYAFQTIHFTMCISIYALYSMYFHLFIKLHTVHTMHFTIFMFHTMYAFHTKNLTLWI